ncbi:unnamed protein product [Diamesa hyperborea]
MHRLNIRQNVSYMYEINALYTVCPSSYPIRTTEETDVAEELRRLAIPLHDVFALIDWRGYDYGYSKYFKEILTDDGMCFVYNMLDHKDLLHDVIHDTLKNPKTGLPSSKWTMERGYQNLSDSVYPLRALGSGIEGGLVIRLLALKEDLDYKCGGPVQGFKVLLHSPADYPRLTKQYYRVPLKKEVIMTISAKVIETNPNLRKYKPKVRQCYFQGEKKLKRQYCGQSADFDWIVATWNPDSTYGKEGNCNCLPSCNSISYDADSSYGEYYYNEYLETVESQFDEDK